MSLRKAIQHNQSLFISALISILCFGGILACHLTQKQTDAIIDTTTTVAEIAASATPTPWREILLAAVVLLGSGSVIDNRRKDVLIKRLKKENANHLDLVSQLAAPNHNATSRPTTLCNN
jgi:hypothetical protein